MSTTELTAVVVEWAKLGEEPALLMATDYNQARRKLIAQINAKDEALYGGLSGYDGTPEGWWHDHPAPTGSATDEDIEDWLNEYHEVADMPWWTFYAVDLEPFLANQESYTPPNLGMWLDAQEANRTEPERKS